MSTPHPFEGWKVADPSDPFETHNGPIYWTRNEDGSTRCGFLVERRHCNGHDAVHGGMYMLLGDYALFSIARDRLRGPGVTVSMNTDFTSAAVEGDAVYADGDVMHETGKMLFVRGRMYTDRAVVCTFSGIIRRVRRS